MSRNINHLSLTQNLAGLHWIHWCVIIASLVLTLSAWRISKNAVEEKITNAFERESHQIIELITERMLKYEDALWAGVAAIHSHNQAIDHKAWLRFTNTLEIESKYPGVNGIGVIYYVPPESLNAFLSNQRLTRPDFHIHPEHDKDEYWPITFIEPISINQKALGLDMAHEANRLGAAKKARDTGKAQITGPIVLVQDSENTPGFLFYAPFYSKQSLESINDRREHFIGLVYAPFIMSKLMQGTLEREKRHIGIKISEGKNILYDEHIVSIADFDPNPLFTQTVSLDFYGRPWEIDMRSSLDFRKATIDYQPLMILVGGVIIEFLLIILFISLARTNRAISSQLTISEKSHQFYIEASGDGYWDWYIQKDYQYMSPRFWEIFGYSPEEKPHKPSSWQDIIFEDDLKQSLENFEQHVKTKGQHPYEQQVRYRHKCGSIITVLCRGRVIEWDEQGKPVRMVGTHTDITALKEAESALIQANAELEEFAYRTSHDLRSPLISSTKLLNIIEENLDKGEVEQSIKYLNIVQNSLKKLEHLVSDILKLTKHNHHQTHYVTVDIKTLVEDSLQKFSHMDGFDRIRFIFEYDDNQPVMVIKDHLILIIENLLSNAIKYQDYGKEVPQVTLSTKRKGNNIEIRITDNGLGIPEKSREKIFLMFKRFHPKTSFGSGLGLYMVKRSVNKMGGSIEYHDTGEGSQFTITLPV